MAAAGLQTRVSMLVSDPEKKAVKQAQAPLPLSIKPTPAPGSGPRVSCCSRQSTARIEGSNTGVRPTHHRLASIKRDEQAA